MYMKLMQLNDLIIHNLNSCPNINQISLKTGDSGHFTLKTYIFLTAKNGVDIITSKI